MPSEVRLVMSRWRDPAAIARAVEVLGPAARRDAPLGVLTTYRVGGPAAVLVECDATDDLSRVAAAAAASGLEIMAVGKGSNLLIADGGYDGIVVMLGPSFADVVCDPPAEQVTAGGAAALPVLARQSVAAGLRGLEWAVGVPGTVGGAVRMNAGGHGSDIATSLLEVELFDFDDGISSMVRASALDFRYRSSAVSAQQLVTRARFEARRGDPDAAQTLLTEIVQWRRANQPGGQNAGSVFVNPEGTTAGAEIDAAGLKGLRLGSAEVSPKHANFIQADPDGSANDVYELMEKVVALVRERRGVELHTEIRRIGFGAVPEPTDPSQESP